MKLTELPGGLSISDLVNAAGNTFGTPHTLRITGSQAVGFANNASDLDLYAVVDADVDPLPILQHLNEVRVEVKYFSRGVVAQWWPLIERFLAGFPLTTSNEHLRLHYALEHVGRLCCGLDLIDPDPSITALLPSESAVSRMMSRYWSLMAARNRMARSDLRGLSALLS